LKVLITGASGFVGSYICKVFAEAGWDVSALVRTAGEPERLKALGIKVNVVVGNLEDYEKVDSILNFVKPAVIIHAAWGGVANYDRNEFVQVSNIYTSSYLLKASIKNDVKRFIGIGSQAEYGPCEGIIKESQKELPTTLYGETKLATYKILKQICKGSEIQLDWVRIFSTYGPLDNEHWLIPSVYKKLLIKEEMKLTPGRQLWDYLYIEDAALAFLKIVENDGQGNLYNLGSGTAFELRDIIGVMTERLHLDSSFLKWGAIDYRLDQVMHLQADINNLREIGWTPTTTLDEGFSNLSKKL